MSITFNELLHGHLISDVPIACQHNLEELLKRINVIRDAWGKPMIVTSGFRTQVDQMRINPKAPNSAHTRGQAVDILDEGLLLTAWLKSDGAKLAEDTGLWFEEGNKNWVHAQIVAPRSGHRWFLP